MRYFKENLCRFLKDFHLTNSFSNLFFLKSSKDSPTKIYEDLQNNEISGRSSHKIVMRSHSLEDLKKRFGCWLNRVRSVIKMIKSRSH